MTEPPLTLDYCGPIAAPGKPARGGYEAANRRLIDDLRALGIEVREHPYAPERRSRLGKYLAYGWSFLRLTLTIGATARRQSIFHITPLRDRFTLPEALLCRVAKLRGAKVVVDMRAGTLARDLGSKRPLERRALRSLIRAADMVAYEGAEYADLLAPLARDCLYLPNYVDAVRPEVGVSPIPITLAYVGRLVPEKGIEVVIDTLRSLLASGVEARLTVIGRGEDAYLERLQRETAGLPVDWVGPVPHSVVRQHLASANFFVFPTRHYGEGHSNALTEAMSQGLVPLVADNGFNSSIVGNAGAVLPKEADGAAYAKLIGEIVADQRWLELSSAARRRTEEQFSRDKVVPKLVARYRQLVV